MLKIAHRGASGYFPENTLLAFRRALEMGAHGLELDVHICKSGEPVVIHDAALSRTTNGKGAVKDKTLEELKKLDAGKGERIPTLTETFDLVDKNAFILIELKSSDSAIPVAKLVTDYVKNKGWKYEQLPIIGFDRDLLQQVKNFNPSIAISPSYKEMPPDNAASAERLGAWAVSPCIDYLTPDFVKDAHTRGLKIFAWTANSEAQISRAHLLGVDGIMSDFVDKL